MFTTQVGPEQLADDHRTTLLDCLTENLIQIADLPELLQKRSGFQTADQLLQQNFELFFKIFVPKAVAKLGLSEDWYCDPATGVKLFEFTRNAARGPYKMLHLIMDFVKPIPDRDHRVGGIPATAQNAYGDAVKQIVTNELVMVTPEIIDAEKLRKNLKRIFQRRKKYYPEDSPAVI
jgi:hypothetical protein